MLILLLKMEKNLAIAYVKLYIFYKNNQQYVKKTKTDAKDGYNFSSN